jgi:hypothetical protein
MPTTKLKYHLKPEQIILLLIITCAALVTITCVLGGALTNQPLRHTETYHGINIYILPGINESYYLADLNGIYIINNNLTELKTNLTK